MARAYCSSIKQFLVAKLDMNVEIMVTLSKALQSMMLNASVNSTAWRSRPHAEPGTIE